MVGSPHVVSYREYHIAGSPQSMYETTYNMYLQLICMYVFIYVCNIYS